MFGIVTSHLQVVNFLVDHFLLNYEETYLRLLAVISTGNDRTPRGLIPEHQSQSRRDIARASTECIRAGRVL